MGLEGQQSFEKVLGFVSSAAEKGRCFLDPNSQ
jgi:hypothetical protein